MPSLPSWERGLKYRNLVDDHGQDIVAPFVGAWIEIFKGVCQKGGKMSLPSWERGLK